MVETARVELASRDNATSASTSVVSILLFHLRLGLPTGFDAASLIDLFRGPQTGDLAA